MHPLAILIEEHNTTQKVLDTLQALSSNLQQLGKDQVLFFSKIVDFFRFYVDHCHHGKEEKILFKKAAEKNLSEEEKKLLAELLEEHKIARALVAELDKNKSSKDLTILKNIMDKIISLYSMHIEKENNRFFHMAFAHFSQDEQGEMLAAFIDVDSKMIHEKYLQVAQELANNHY